VDKSLLDTDILSEVLKARSALIIDRVIAYKAAFGVITLSVITVMEVVKGLHKVQRADALRKFLEGLKTSEVIAFDQACAELAGRIYGDLERAGQPVGRADPMIAASAIAYGLTLVTGNMSHYQRIQSLGYPLKLDNWRQE
jgi:tRNA(fMet)-specific endonuclease VapC